MVAGGRGDQVVGVVGAVGVIGVIAGSSAGWSGGGRCGGLETGATWVLRTGAAWCRGLRYVLGGSGVVL